MRIITFLLLLFFYSPIVLAHGGEDHGEPNSGPVASSAPVITRTATQKTSIAREVKTGTGTYNFNITYSPPVIKAGEQADFKVQVAEVIQGSLEGGQLTVELRKNNGKIEKILIAAENSPGIYNFSYTFPEGETYQVTAGFTGSNNKKVPLSFSVSVYEPKPNYRALILDFLALLLVVGAIGLFYTKTPKGGANTARIKNTAVFSTIVLAALVITVAIIHLLVKPEEPVTAEIPSTPELAAENIIKVPKETQLLFNITTVPAAYGEIVSGLNVNGQIRVRPQSRAAVTAPVSGLVRLNDFSVGTYVRKGQVLGTVQQVLGTPERLDIESTMSGLRTNLAELQSGLGPAQARLRAARLEAENARAAIIIRNTELQSQIEQLEARLRNARTELERASELYEIGAAPLKRVQEARLQVQLLELELEAARKLISNINGSEANRRLREAEREVSVNQQELAGLERQIGVLEQNQRQLQGNSGTGFDLLAPIDGRIADISTGSGQVEAGKQVLSVVNLETVWLEAQVFENYLDEISSANKASFTVAAYPDRTFDIGPETSNRLLTIGTAVDPEKRTVPVIFEINNPGERIREGMFADITIDTSGNTKVISVPREAVSEETGLKYVYVFRGGENFEKRQISTGDSGQEHIQVNSGLQPGERVVTEGIYQLRTSDTGGV